MLWRRKLTDVIISSHFSMLTSHYFFFSTKKALNEWQQINLQWETLFDFDKELLFKAVLRKWNRQSQNSFKEIVKSRERSVVENLLKAQWFFFILCKIEKQTGNVSKGLPKGRKQLNDINASSTQYENHALAARLHLAFCTKNVNNSMK